ncbi:unnamed protein product [Rotaria sp. Silwood1]|nr:unnamed protein product [Rotaria sp. Silwood1]
MIKLKNYRQLSEHYQSFLYQRFIDTSQSEKFGYPKVIDSIEISTPGRMKQIFVDQGHLKGDFRDLIQEIFQGTNQNSFRDHVELQQATKWLHENGSIKEQD